MSKNVIIQQVAASDFLSDMQTIIRETIKSEVGSLIPKTTNQKTEIYGTRKEVAKELKISLPTLTEHTQSGNLKGYRIGGRVLYKWDEVFESLELIKSLKYKRGVIV